MELTTYNRRETVVIGAEEQPGDGTRYTFLIVLYGVEGDIPKKNAKAMDKVLAGRDVPPFPAQHVSIFPKDDGATLKGSIQDIPYEALAQMACAQARVPNGDDFMQFGLGDAMHGKRAMQLKKDVFRRHGRRFRSAGKAVAFCQMQTTQALGTFFRSIGL